MLGYTQPDNDVYIFFENYEIKKLEREKIQGTYFNLKNPAKIGLLEASINNEIYDRIKTSINKNEEKFITNLLLEMRTIEYKIIQEKGLLKLHEGFRHVYLINSNNLDFSDKINYRQLKYWESQFTI